MFALILSICMAPINVNGSDESQIFAIGPEICEENHVAQYATMQACIKGMDKNIEATKRSVLAPFDWAYSCEKVKK